MSQSRAVWKLTLSPAGERGSPPTWLAVREMWVEQDQQTGSLTDEQRVIMIDTGEAGPGHRPGC